MTPGWRMGVITRGRLVGAAEEHDRVVVVVEEQDVRRAWGDMGRYRGDMGRYRGDIGEIWEEQDVRRACLAPGCWSEGEG